ncbi:MAG: hypothetical protein AMXMBFR7_42030 [Planctomycetota bacterium]
MSRTFSLPSEVFPRSGVTRMLHEPGCVRFVVAMFIEHPNPPNSHTDMVLPGFAANLVLRGTGRYIDSSGTSYRLEPGVLFHRFPGRKHSSLYDAGTDYAECFVVFDEHSGQGLAASGMLPREPVLNVGVQPSIVREFRHLLRRLEAPEREVPGRLALWEATQFLQGLWERARLRGEQDTEKKLIDEACRLLAGAADGREPLEQIARELGLSYATFRKRFREATGLSPGSYRIRQRLQRACQLLPHHSIKHVAAELGYRDPFTFSAQFKSAMGVSPRAFKQKLGQSQGD